MTTAFLFISFMLHIVLLLVVWQLMKQVKTLKMNQPEDIMEIFDTYLEEVKEENRLLQTQLSTQSDEHNEQPGDSVKNTSVPETPETDDCENVTTPADENDIALSLEANVLYLHSQGYTIEEIARKLHKGKTEVNLIVKFHNGNK